MAKKRLFITVGTYTTAISAALIEQLNEPNCENYLVSIAPTFYENVDEHIKMEAQQLGIFKQVLFYYDFCLPKSNFNNEKKHILSFNFQKFKEATGKIDFDEIYSVYIHGAANYLFNQYPNATLYFMEDGIATYLKMDNAEIINKRAKKIYTINYFNKIKPFITLYEKVQTETIDRKKLRAVFEKLSKNIDFRLEKKEKSIIFCAQNLSINPKVISYQNELNLYKKNIQNLLNKGYCVYFKDHPKTPNLFYKNLKQELPDSNFIGLKNYSILPVEILIPILKPFAIVSMFSSALFTVPQIYDVPAFTFFAENIKLNNIAFELGSLLVASYIPPIDSIKKDIFETQNIFDSFFEKTPPINQQAIYLIKIIDQFKMFISRSEFNRIKKLFQKSHKFLLKEANLPQEVINIYQNQSYFDFIIFYLDSFTQQYQNYIKKRQQKSEPITAKEIIKNGLTLLTKLIL